MNASLKFRVFKALISLKRNNDIISFEIKTNFFSPSSISALVKLRKDLEISVHFERSNRDHPTCFLAQSRARQICFFLKDACDSELLRQYLRGELNKRKYGALQENEFLFEVENLLINSQTPIRRIHKATEAQDKNGVDYWIIYKKKLQVPINIKSSKKFQEKFRRDIPSLTFFPNDKKLLRKLEIICDSFKRGIIAHL